MESSTRVISKEGLIEISKEQDWGDLWLVLLAHTLKRLKYRYGIKEPKDALVERARNILSEVLGLLFIEGKRNWNTEHYDTFQEFVISVVDSHLSNSFSKIRAGELPLDNVQQKSGVSGNIEDATTYLELKKQVYDLLTSEKTSDEELMVFDCMADGILKPKEIREELGITPEEFNNIWRKLNRKIVKIREKLSGYDS